MFLILFIKLLLTIYNTLCHVLKMVHQLGYNNHVHIGTYFIVKHILLLHICTLYDGEINGDFINFPESHDTSWQREYAYKYEVDFDYYPRGRIIFNRVKDIYLLYHDPCIVLEASALCKRYPIGKCVMKLDEHYKCNICNKAYVNVFKYIKKY